MHAGTARLRVGAVVFFLAAMHLATPVRSQQDGTILEADRPVFPIGFYYVPEEDAVLRDMAEAAIKLGSRYIDVDLFGELEPARFRAEDATTGAEMTGILMPMRK